jgi:hypothetical protein
MVSSLLKLVIVTGFEATEVYTNLDMTEAKYSISILSEAEKENVIVRISHSNFSACRKGKSI